MKRPDRSLPQLPLAPSPRRSDVPLPAPQPLAPQQSAVALAYGADDAAPRVVAKGRGLVAQAIVERARAHGVYVHESKELVSLLMQVDLDQRIPPALYRAVAELLVWIYRLEHAPAPAIGGNEAGNPPL